MTLDEISDQFSAVLARARTVLHQEVEKAQKTMAAANAEKTAAANALTELKEQHSRAQTELKSTLAHLDKASTRVGLDREIVAGRKVLDRLKTETAEAEAALAALHEQRKQAESKLVGLNNEAQRQLSIRLESEAVVANLRNRLQQTELGRRS
jgi:hypothetical protein